MKEFFSQVNWAQVIVEVVLFGTISYLIQTYIDQKWKRKEQQRIFIQEITDEVRLALSDYQLVYSDIPYFMSLLLHFRADDDFKNLSKAFKKEDEAWQDLWKKINRHKPYFERIGLDAKTLEEEHLNLIGIANPDFEIHVPIETEISAVNFALEECRSYSKHINSIINKLAVQSLELR